MVTPTGLEKTSHLHVIPYYRTKSDAKSDAELNGNRSRIPIDSALVCHILLLFGHGQSRQNY